MEPHSQIQNDSNKPQCFILIKTSSVGEVESLMGSLSKWLGTCQCKQISKGKLMHRKLRI